MKQPLPGFVIKSSFFLVLSIVLFLFAVPSALAATYYVNSNCNTGCDGSTLAKGWRNLVPALYLANVPAVSTVEVAAGSGPYYNAFAPSSTQDNVTWNFNGTEVRRDVDLGSLAGTDGYHWTASANPAHLGEYYLSRTTTNFLINGSMEADRNWETYATGALKNERSSDQAHSGSYSRHVVTSVSGIQQSVSGLTPLTKTYKISGWYYAISGNLIVSFLGSHSIDTTGLKNSWQHFEFTGTAGAGVTTATLLIYQSGAAEFYIDDVAIEELDAGLNPVTKELTPLVSANPISYGVVDGTWSAGANQAGLSNVWDWGDYDTLGFNAFYVRWTGGNPTGHGVEILASPNDYVGSIATGLDGQTFNDAKFIGGNNIIMYVREPATFNRCFFEYTNGHAISAQPTAAGTTTIINSIFIDTGHRGVNITSAANPIDIYNSFFYGMHLELRGDGAAINGSVVNFVNNSSKNAYAGNIQWTNNTSTFNESYNQYHIDFNSAHTGKRLSWYPAAPGETTWALSAVSDLPGNFNVKDGPTLNSSDCDLSQASCGTDPQVDSNGIPAYNSPLIDAGTTVAGRTNDYLGNSLYGTPDIGPYEYQPPHTMGTNNIDVGSGARVYGDGKFRDVGTVSGSTANLTITPASGSFYSYGSTETRPQWLDISSVTWVNSGTRHKAWTESSTYGGLTNTIHTVGDLEANKYYNVKVDNDLGHNITGSDCSGGICKSNSSGKITFTYTGTYSNHTFDVLGGDNTGPNIYGPTVIYNDNSATVSWTTDEASTSRVDYGFTDNYVSTTEDTNRVTEHAIGLTDLMSCHDYHYRVYSKDALGNDRFSTDNMFTTTGCPVILEPSGSSPAYSYYLPSAQAANENFPTTGVSGSSITFDASDLFPGQTIIKYTWDFGDGSTDEGKIVNHTYNAPGRYTITITGTDINGNKTTVEKTIDINPTAPAITNITSTGDTDMLIEGTGYKNDTIYLTIHSNPIDTKATVDNTGKWTYTLSQASETIGEGDHTTSAIDSFKLADNTELKSATSKDYSFKVSVDNGKLKIEQTKTSRWRAVALILGGLVVLIIIVVALRRRNVASGYSGR